jgi:uncharacterized alkaline shock family protein YloU
MPDGPMPGRGLATRRAVGDVVRRAALGSYGVVSVSGPRPWHTALALIGRSTPGVRIRLGPPLTVDLYLAVARGVPVAEVAHNVEAAVRYGVVRALGREIDALGIHIDRLRTPTRRPGEGAGSPGRGDGPVGIGPTPEATVGPSTQEHALPDPGAPDSDLGQGVA